MKHPRCVMGVKEWLWAASGKGFCLFDAADTRGRVELETMLGTEFAGVLSSDNFSVYNGCQITAQQNCLAHLRRHFKKVLGLPSNNNNATVAQIFLSLIDEAFRSHESWRKTKEQLTYDSWAEDFKIRLNLALATWPDLGVMPQVCYSNSYEIRQNNGGIFSLTPRFLRIIIKPNVLYGLLSRNGKFLVALVR